MLVCIDVSLEDPSYEIDISRLITRLNNEINYEVISYYLENFILIRKIDNQNVFRIHKDGRIYVKNYLDDNEESVLNNEILISLYSDLKEFLQKFLNLINQNELRNEVNFNFTGKISNCFFWGQYPQINKIGDMLFRFFEIKTYSPSCDTISAKVKAA